MAESREYFFTLGCVSSIMMRSAAYCQYPIVCLSEWIKPPILLDQIAVLTDDGGNLIGYFTWAFLAADVEQRLITDSAVLLHLSEWNEGDRVWIMDLVVLNGDLRRFFRHMLKVLPAITEARSLRRREDGSVRKISVWRRGLACRSRTTA